MVIWEHTFPEPHHVSLAVLPNATLPAESSADQEKGGGVTSTELFELKDVQCLPIDRSTKRCHSAFPRAIGSTPQHSLENKKINAHTQAGLLPIPE